MMGKIIKCENFRVEVEPRSIGDYGFASISDYAIEPNENKRNERYERICECIVEDIKRHVDDVGWVGVVYDTSEVCSFCGNEWEVNEDPNDEDWELGEPLCCDEATSEWKMSKGGR
jgi:hypothetical protein